ncbi:MAG: PLP-dependent aminotransferase family protein [Polyangiaceae bacterium]
MNRPVGRPSLPLALPNSGPGEPPLFVAIARTLSAEILKGRLKPGQRLPGSRNLAATLGVHRNTVLAALAELSEEGWVETRPASGTFVSQALPIHRPKAFARRARDPLHVGFDLRGVVPDDELPLECRYHMGGGAPDLRLLPRDVLARAYRRALRALHRLDYADPRGEASLRHALAAHLSATRGLALSADDLLVTRGSQMALDLAARSLFRAGDIVAVEAWGYRPAWRALQAHGIELSPIPVDAHGIDVDRLTALCREKPQIRGVYVTPHHQYPTTVTLSAPRRLQLLALAQERRLCILEDDYDHEFHYEGRPILPLASADDAGVVVYLGTLSKILAPGLRLGYVTAPRAALDAMTRARRYVDRQGDAVLEAALAELFEDGEVMRHARRMQRVYRARRDATLAALDRDFGDLLRVRAPAGGMAFWATVHKGVDVDAWCARARDAGVVLYPASRYAFSGKKQPYLRIGYAALDDEERTQALALLRRTARGAPLPGNRAGSRRLPRRAAD